MNIAKICNRIIEYSFYALFFFVPLSFAGDTSELFELNKIWLTFALTIIIAAAWGVKIILQRQIHIQKTPLDIPILLFLLSQLIATVFSLDSYISLWGYYSRFNGGFLSILTYVFLYYAFVSQASELQKERDQKKPSQQDNSLHLPFLLGGMAIIPTVLLIYYLLTLAFPFLFGYFNNDEFTKFINPLIILSFIASFFLFIFAIQASFIKKVLCMSLFSGCIVILWGLPSHFGYDPTCLLFRGNFDVSCWTEAFQPKIRIFSTLGQPNWLAAYLSILLPIAIAFGIVNSRSGEQNPQQMQNAKFKIFNFELQLLTFIFALLTLLFYVAILFTGSRSGFLGLLAGGAIFFFLSKQKIMLLKFVVFPLLMLSLLIGTPLDQQLKQITGKFLPKSFSTISDKPQAISNPSGPALETGGTESGKIRLIVWRGAIDAWLHNPLFGTGVETFAFAYYKYRPVAHNVTSEWDYLYNKAHNEYLNYLATTGVFGLGTYLFMISAFIFFVIKQLLQSQNSTKTFLLAFLASYVSILVSNFLGFSVVIINLYLFLIPAFAFVFANALNPNKVFSYGNSVQNPKHQSQNITFIQQLASVAIVIIGLFFLFTLYRFWEADKAYARGFNLDRAGEYQYGYLDLITAVEKRPSEPVFLDELSYNTGVLSVALATQKDQDASESAKIATYAARLAKETLALSDNIVSDHPNNLVFWKTRIRLLNLLSQNNPDYLPLALDAIKKASELAPTDAKVFYTLAILYGQSNEREKAIETLEKTIRLKPNYRDAYYALALFYHDTATDKNSKVINPTLQQKAIDTMQFIVDNIASDDAQAKEAIKTWKTP